MKNYTIEKIKEMFNNAGYDLISKEYKNARSKLEYICRRHPQKGIQFITLNDFKKGSMCVYCRYDDGIPYNKPWPDDIVEEALDKIDCDYIGRPYKQKGIIQFVCRKHPEKGVQETNWSSIKEGKSICKVCNGTGRNTEDFRLMMKDINPNIEVLGEYTGAKKHIRCKCKIDGHEWEPYTYNLLSGYGCPKCAERKVGEVRRTPVDEKMARLIELHPDIDFLSTPVLSSDYVLCRCKNCGHEWQALYSNLAKRTKATGCPHCTTSASEKQITKILTNWKLNFKPQYCYDDLRDTNKLPFDFYLLDFNVLIEFDGEHHYRPIPRFKNDPDGKKAFEEFQKTIKHDNMKSDYCFFNKIPLIRIPFWHRDDLEYYLFDKLVENKVIELL